MLRLFGHILMGAGVLWATTSGVCTALFGLSWQNSGNPDHLFGILQLGVPSILFGVLLYLFGHYIVSKT
jgi:hypothetical protein